ncbi:MAG TPA: HNH endonuclease [Kiritimatiellia bacterium]|nr:HNH endonuclease [Kiritimatiellia bacterium]HMP35200.1 HNH endonuclease [Kiritimatiellia bacterium]
MTDSTKSMHAHWLGQLRKLNPATGRGACHGKAPHKPLLLLSLLDQIEDGELTRQTFTRDAGLVLRFRTYGSLTSDRWPTRLDLKMPFYHLKSQGFWTAHQADGAPARSPESCVACTLHEDFFRAAMDPGLRLKARLLLIDTYFTPSEQVALLESMGLGDYRDATHPRRTDVIREAEKAAKRKGRSARFAVQVVARYRFTCALTGLSCMTTEGASIVDAAHIDPWSRSRNDELTNGLALCKNAHWSFDQGLWSVNPHGTILVAQPRFTEAGPDALRLIPYTNRPLNFAPSTTLRPDPAHFAEHRKRWGLV